VPAMPEPERRIPNGSNDPSVRRLTRLQQLTLNTWRRAAAKVNRDVASTDILAHVAIHAALAVLRDTNNPIALFARHDARAEEFGLVASLAECDRSRDALHDLLDTAFLLRWAELTSDGVGPEELPPLTRRPFGHPPLLP
jgi:hypothetical protein